MSAVNNGDDRTFQIINTLPDAVLLENSFILKSNDIMSFRIARAFSLAIASIIVSRVPW